HVRRDVPAADRRRRRALERDSHLADPVDDEPGERVAVRRGRREPAGKRRPLDADAGALDDAPCGLGHLGADAVAFEQDRAVDGGHRDAYTRRGAARLFPTELPRDVSTGIGSRRWTTAATNGAS